MGTDKEGEKKAYSHKSKEWEIANCREKNQQNTGHLIVSVLLIPQALDVAKTKGRSFVNHPCAVLSDQLQRGSTVKHPNQILGEDYWESWRKGSNLCMKTWADPQAVNA